MGGGALRGRFGLRAWMARAVARSGRLRAIRAVYLRYYALSTAYAAPRWVWIGMDEPYEHERGAM